jgi:hypothetical protein
MMASVGGRGFCLRCLAPLDAIPLVPVVLTQKRFIAIKRMWERAARDHNTDVRAEVRSLDSGTRRVVTKKREGPAPDDLLMFLGPRPDPTRKRQARRGQPRGTPLKLDETKIAIIRTDAARQPWTPQALAERHGLSVRTIKRVPNMNLRRPLSTESDLRRLKDDVRREPWDLPKLAARHGLTASQMVLVLKKQGLQLKRSPRSARRTRRS